VKRRLFFIKYAPNNAQIIRLMWHIGAIS